MRKRKSPSVLKKVKSILRSRYFEDYSFRTILTALAAFCINVGYTVYNGVLGILNHSEWFLTMAVYYSLLGIMRYGAVSAGGFT